ncbi:MAG: NAD-dependent epimerase/dehydratase family protein [Bacteroidetes bacterium]|nr:NAD-dependent epimerase/dehydratase family protein [Bacteroidota bacterium]
MVFVTGGTGLVGSHLLIDLVRMGKDVVALKRTDSNLEPVRFIFESGLPGGTELFSKIKWIDGDILDIAGLSGSMKNCDEVYHCAAIVSNNPHKKKMMIDANVRGAANMVNAAMENSVRKFCFVSSIAVLGSEYEIGSGEMIDERNDQGTIYDYSTYAVTKLGGEREVWRGMAEGLNAVIVNPGVIIGPGNWGKSSTSFFTTLRKGLKFYSTGIIGFVDARDVAKVMVELMGKNIFGERYIVIAENLSYRDVLFNIAGEINARKPSIHVGKRFLNIAWRFEHLRSFIFNLKPALPRDIAQPAYQKLYYSNKKISDTLNYRFIPIKKAITDTARIFLEWEKKNAEKITAEY